MRSVLYCGVRGRIGRSTQRLFFTTPPIPPGLPPAPAASDAKPFFKAAAEKHTSSTSSSLNLSSSSQTLSSTKTKTTTTTTTTKTIISEEASNTSHAEKEENVSKNDLKSNDNNNNNNNNNNNGRSSLGNSTSSQSVEQPKEKYHDDAQKQHHHHPNPNPSPQRSSFFSPETFGKHVPTPAKFAASLVADALNLPPKWGPTPEPSGEMRQEYREHCVLGWSPHNLYHVVADVAQYSTFLPWCLDSIVHQVKRLDNEEAQKLLQEQQPNTNNNNNNNDNNNNNNNNSNSSSSDNNISPTSNTPMEMLATLTVGFSFFKEKYTSRVFLVPGKKVQAMLNEGNDQRRSPVLSDLHCVWEFNAVPGKDQQVEVRFIVSFAFKNPLHSKFIMSHVVSLMTRSFEKHCEKLYGPPSCERERLTV